MEPAVPWRRAGDGFKLAVRVTPRAAHDGLAGTALLADGRAVLAVRLRAVPAEGAANDALLALLAGALGVPRRNLAITRGATARLKEIAVAGVAESALAALCETGAGRMAASKE